MLARVIAISTLIGMTVVVLAQSPVPPGTYFTATEIAALIAGNAGERSGMAAGRMVNTGDYRVNMIHRTEAAGAIVHEVGTEIHYITSGAGTLVTGGVAVRPADGGQATVDGGDSRRVTVGDLVLIPEGTPHWYSAVEDHVTYLEVRF